MMTIKINDEEPFVAKAINELSVVFTNNSGQNGNMTFYQQYPKSTVGNTFSVAWWSKYMYDNSKSYYTWTPDHQAIWAETGELKPGVQCRPGQSQNMDPSGENTITLSYDNEAYHFENPESSQQQGINIKQNKDLPDSDLASIGLGMDNQVTLAVQAEPNLISSFDVSNFEYWACFGSIYEQYEAMDLTLLQNTQQVVFPSNVTQLSVSINADFKWEVSPISSVDYAFLMKSLPE